ncbi:hypothetical protein GCM10022231_19690 [Gordonia caeni]|uniref:Uncharacterized protein n=1 Tax=Gordonia caeni TaxID=1007097 RepID=A0ABP7P599_9ACTN
MGLAAAAVIQSVVHGAGAAVAGPVPVTAGATGTNIAVASTASVRSLDLRPHDPARMDRKVLADTGRRAPLGQSQ